MCDSFVKNVSNLSVLLTLKKLSGFRYYSPVHSENVHCSTFRFFRTLLIKKCPTYCLRLPFIQKVSILSLALLFCSKSVLLLLSFALRSKSGKFFVFVRLFSCNKCSTSCFHSPIVSTFLVCLLFSFKRCHTFRFRSRFRSKYFHFLLLLYQKRKPIATSIRLLFDIDDIPSCSA